MPLPSIQITGTVVADPELRFTPSGKAVVNFRVASNKPQKTEAGGWTDGESCFLTVNAWERKAEAIAEEVVKGSKVIVTGTLRQRDYETQQGEKRTVYEVQAYDVALVVKARTADRERPSEPTQDPWSTPAGTSTQTDPWAQPAPDGAPF